MKRDEIHPRGQRRRRCRLAVRPGLLHRLLPTDPDLAGITLQPLAVAGGALFGEESAVYAMPSSVPGPLTVTVTGSSVLAQPDSASCAVAAVGTVMVSEG
jgi:hypothetical protein